MVTYPSGVISKYPVAACDFPSLLPGMFPLLVLSTFDDEDNDGFPRSSSVPFLEIGGDAGSSGSSGSSSSRTVSHWPHRMYSMGLAVLQLVHVHCRTEAMVPILKRFSEQNTELFFHVYCDSITFISLGMISHLVAAPTRPHNESSFNARLCFSHRKSALEMNLKITNCYSAVLNNRGAVAPVKIVQIRIDQITFFVISRIKSR